MARETLASLRAVIELLKQRLASARSRDADEMPIGDLSMTFLRRIETLMAEKREEMEDAEQELENLDRLYDEVDGADDTLRDLNLDD